MIIVFLVLGPLPSTLLCYGMQQQLVHRFHQCVTPPKIQFHRGCQPDEFVPVTHPHFHPHDTPLKKDFHASVVPYIFVTLTSRRLKVI